MSFKQERAAAHKALVNAEQLVFLTQCLLDKDLETEMIENHDLPHNKEYAISHCYFVYQGNGPVCNAHKDLLQKIQNRDSALYRLNSGACRIVEELLKSHEKKSAELIEYEEACNTVEKAWSEAIAKHGILRSALDDEWAKDSTLTFDEESAIKDCSAKYGGSGSVVVANLNYRTACECHENALKIKYRVACLIVDHLM